MSKLIEIAQQVRQVDWPDFKAGDTIRVYLKIQEKNRERLQLFQGTVIQRKGQKLADKTFTVRKVSKGIAVERIFPLCLPSIQKIEVVSTGIVRRARLFYLRGRTGQATKIKHRVEPGKKSAQKSEAQSMLTASVPETEAANRI